MQKNPTVRNVCFTIPNPTEELLTSLRAPKQGIRYCVWQLEISPTTRTPHIQGYLELDKPQRFSGIKSLLSCNTAHLEQRMGTRLQAIEYCRKTDSRAPGDSSGPFEWGDGECTQGKRSDLQAACSTLETEGLLGVARQHPTAFVKYHRGFAALDAITRSAYTGKVRKVAIFGPTGTGKTWKALHDFGTCYVWNGISSGTVFFDNYQGEETIILDDFRGLGSGWNLDFFLRFTNDDCIVRQLNIKGGTVPNNARTIVVTSPLAPATWFPKGKGEDVKAQIERRFKEVIHMTEPWVPPPPPVTPEAGSPASGGLAELFEESEKEFEFEFFN